MGVKMPDQNGKIMVTVWAFSRRSVIFAALATGLGPVPALGQEINGFNRLKATLESVIGTGKGVLGLSRDGELARSTGAAATAHGAEFALPPLTFTLSGVGRLRIEGGRLRLGSVGAEGWPFRLDLPPALSMTDTEGANPSRVTIGTARIEGVWRDGADEPARLDARLDRLAAGPEGKAATVTIERVTLTQIEREPGVPSLAIVIEQLGAGHVQGDARLAARQLRIERSAVPSGIGALLRMGNLATLIPQGARIDVAADDLVLVDVRSGLGGEASDARVTATVTARHGVRADLDVEGEFNEFDVPGGPVPPELLPGTGKFRGRLGGLALGEVPGPDPKPTLTALAPGVPAASEWLELIELETLSAENRQLTLAARGRLATPGPGQPFAGRVDATVGGINAAMRPLTGRLVDREARQRLLALALIRGLGVPRKEGSETTAHDYAIERSPTAKLTINGTDVTNWVPAPK
jgi:hypothetical protein